MAFADVRPLTVNGGYLVSFGEDAHGRIYTVAFDGAVSRLRAVR